MAARIAEASCVIKRQAGEHEKLFGSVTNQDTPPRCPARRRRKILPRADQGAGQLYHSHSVAPRGRRRAQAHRGALIEVRAWRIEPFDRAQDRSGGRERSIGLTPSGSGFPRKAWRPRCRCSGRSFRAARRS
jgi:hypothetical protein